MKSSLFKKIKHHKLLLLILSIILAYFLFQESYFDPLREFILKTGYFGTFVAGIFFSYGFTSAPATAVFLLIAKEQNLWLAVIIGGLGSLVGNFFIFNFIKKYFKDDIKKVAKQKLVLYVEHKLSHKIRKYVALASAGIILASPLPDEIGISMLAFTHMVSPKEFYIASFILHSLGILVIIWFGSLI